MNPTFPAHIYIVPPVEESGDCVLRQRRLNAVLNSEIFIKYIMGFKRELMFANANVKYNTSFGNGSTTSTTLRTKSGPEKINITASSILTDFIDFTYFWRLLRMLLDTFDVDE